MDKYKHIILFQGPGASEYSEAIGDHVYHNIPFRVETTNHSKNISWCSDLVYCPLPAPDPNNFVPGLAVSDEDRSRWINECVDIIAIQNENITKIEEYIQQINASQQNP